MVIILEGPRCVGKSTLAVHLERSGFHLLKMARGEHPTADMIRTISNLKAEKENFVIDRFHLTEMVMSLYFQRREIDEVLSDTKTINTLLLPIAVTFVLRAPLDVLVKRRTLIGREEEMPDEVSQALWGMATLIPGIHTFNTGGGLSERTVQNLILNAKFIFNSRRMK